ncbi:hypothetical protein ACTXT7_010091 [Hymenolepis weldensis]
MNYHLLTEGAHSLSDNYPTNFRSSYSQDADFVENVIIIVIAQSKTSAMSMVTKKASVENFLRTVQRGRTRTTRALNQTSQSYGTLMQLSSGSTLAPISNAV